MTSKYKSLIETCDLLFSKYSQKMFLACPLGLGKPNELLNHIYRHAKNNPTKQVHIYTALSLSLPAAKKDLEKRFLNPFLQRHFGTNYPELEYVKDQKANQVPENIKIIEFYMQSGAMLEVPQAQQNYVNLNYTHVTQTLFERNIEVVVQMIAMRESNGKKQYSLSSNPDLTLDVYELYKKHHKKLFMVGVIHPSLPFMGGDAIVEEDFFDVITTSEAHELFAIPTQPIDPIDHAIGFHASQLVKDDGTLQIGIGSLSDALVNAMILRHKQNNIYQAFTQDFKSANAFVAETSIFHKGLYGTSEMIMDGFMHLRQHNILKREVLDPKDQQRYFLHGAFFLGSKHFYQWLRDLNSSDFKGISMTKVSKVNDLYDENEMAIRRQRKNARFYNTCLQVNLLGGAASDTLENGQVVSGIGGQYNFVAMSHELPDSYSILMLRSTRKLHGKRISNIVWSQGHLSIPRHLRDVVITEYGVAHLRGKTDEECIQAVLNITDSEFQTELLNIAKANGKISQQYKIPPEAQHNTPDKIKKFIVKNKTYFSPYPFGSDFTLEEQTLSIALGQLKNLPTHLLPKYLVRGCRVSKTLYAKELERLSLLYPKTLKELIYQKLVLACLKN